MHRESCTVRGRPLSEVIPMLYARGFSAELVAQVKGLVIHNDHMIVQLLDGMTFKINLEGRRSLKDVS
jgi:hypothetical protein